MKTLFQNTFNIYIIYMKNIMIQNNKLNNIIKNLIIKYLKY